MICFAPVKEAGTYECFLLFKELPTNSLRKKIIAVETLIYRKFPQKASS